jgi:hypothetical protein
VIELEIVDYTIIAAEIAKKRVEPKRHGKAVLIRYQQNRWFVMAPQEFCRFHKDIVHRFFELRRVQFIERGKRIIAAETDWEVLGGCCYEVDDTLPAIRFWGESDAYGQLHFTHGLCDQLSSSDHFAGILVSIDISFYRQI